jgi:hypothetical protein
MRYVARPYEVVSRGAIADGQGRRTQKTINAICPFCHGEVRIFVWSLCGGGKLCACGAKFQSGGEAHKTPRLVCTSGRCVTC